MAVVGAGPAGCAAACALGRAKIDVVVFERGQPGKNKPCGDAFASSAVECLDRFGIDHHRIRSLGGLPFSKFELHQYEPFLAHWQLDHLGGWVIARAVLDQAFRDVTSTLATVQYGAHVSAVTTHPNGVTLSIQQGDRTEEFPCDAVVLASGSGTPLPCKLGISGQSLMGAAVRAYATTDVPEALILQFTDACRPGYRWIFPMTRARVNFGVCTAAAQKARHLRRLLVEFAGDLCVSKVLRWYGGGVPLWSGKGRVWHDPGGVVSCGDAAGVADPLTGEGISAALVSGEEAGRAITRYLREDRNSKPLQEYSSWVVEYFTNRYRRTPWREFFSNIAGVPISFE